METKENVFLEDVHRVFHPQVPGKWDKKFLGRFQNVNTGKYSFSYQHTCRKCEWKTGEQAERFRYCPHVRGTEKGGLSVYLWLCYFATVRDWCTYVIAPSRSKAKMMFADHWSRDMGEYIDVRARKVKPADGFATQVCDVQCPELTALGVRYLTDEEIEALEV